MGSEARIFNRSLLLRLIPVFEVAFLSMYLCCEVAVVVVVAVVEVCAVVLRDNARGMSMMYGLGFG